MKGLQPTHNPSIQEVTTELGRQLAGRKVASAVYSEAVTLFPEDLLRAKITGDKVPSLMQGLRDQILESMSAHGPKPTAEELSGLLQPIVHGFLEAEDGTSNLVSAMSLQGKHPGAQNPKR